MELWDVTFVVLKIQKQKNNLKNVKSNKYINPECSPTKCIMLWFINITMS